MNKKSFCVTVKNPNNLSFRSVALPREESAVLLPSKSRFLADKPGFGMTRNKRCFILALLFSMSSLLWLAGCEAERRKSDAELGLNPQQIEGRHLYDQYCARCHEPYSSRGKNGPSLSGVFKQPYLKISGLPANDERVAEITNFGRSKMPGFGQVMTKQQIDDLLAYMHTL